MKQYFPLGLVVFRRVACALSVLCLMLALSPASAGAQSTGNRRYVALGDSIAAGLGLPVSSSSDIDQLCGRSKQAYPYAVTNAKKLQLEHYACSGAKSDEGLYGKQHVSGPNLTPQLDLAFAKGTPKVISITIGANDMRWSQFVRDCYTWECGSSWDDTRAVAYTLDLQYELHRTLTEIDWRSAGTRPKVLLTGYYNPLSVSKTCSDTNNISPREVRWLTAQLNTLNMTIKEVAGNYSFATYVPVSFAGHELCSKDPWVQGSQSKGAIHPTSAGQAAIAKAVTAKL